MSTDPQPAVAEGATGTVPLLEVLGLTRRYGGVTAVDGLDLSVRSGETLGVIGPNGAGKSTFIGLVAGAIAPSEGTIAIAGQDVTGTGPAGRTKLGIGRTHQIPRPFGDMTVLENLLLAGRHAPGERESMAATRRRCLDVLERAGLADVAQVRAGGLPLLRRKRLELARALALRPRLLLLDEIGAGLVEHETAELIELILQLRTEVESMVLVEHVMEVITSCCERTAVLNFGSLVTQGRTRDVLADATVAAVYLGTATSDADTPDGRPDDRPGGPTGSAPGSDGGSDGGATAASTTRSGSPSAPPRPVGSSLLRVTGAHAAYGGVRALQGVDLSVHEGEVVALLGANGAGKTTLARAVAGVVPLTEGTVHFDGQPLAGLRPDQVTARGIAQCMEGRRIFATLTVEENLLLAAPGLPAAEVRTRLERVYDLFPVLNDRRAASGTAMSGGQQQMLAIGRALMSEPRLVVFDEISLGLAPIAVEQLYAALGRLRSSGVAMLLVEQNLERGLGLADRAYVLSHGLIALTGTPAEVRAHPRLTALYVGEVAEDEPSSTTPS